MDSRRLTAFAKSGITAKFDFQLRLSKQEIATSEMGGNGQVAVQKS